MCERECEHAPLSELTGVTDQLIGGDEDQGVLICFCWRRRQKKTQKDKKKMAQNEKNGTKRKKRHKEKRLLASANEATGHHSSRPPPVHPAAVMCVQRCVCVCVYHTCVILVLHSEAEGWSHVMLAAHPITDLGLINTAFTHNHREKITCLQ